MQVIFCELSQNILRVNDCRVSLLIPFLHPITTAKREKAAGYPKQFLNSCSQVPLTNYFCSIDKLFCPLTVRLDSVCFARPWRVGQGRRSRWVPGIRRGNRECKEVCGIPKGAAYLFLYSFPIHLQTKPGILLPRAPAARRAEYAAPADDVWIFFLPTPLFWGARGAGEGPRAGSGAAKPG